MDERAELCLEVQLDEDAKGILSNPERCRSTLLDVTVIKPHELEMSKTPKINTLKAEQVRKLIASIEKQRRQKRKFMENLKDDDTIIKVRKHFNADKMSRPNPAPVPSPNRMIKTQRKVVDSKRVRYANFLEENKRPEEYPVYCKIRKSLKNIKTKLTDVPQLDLVISQTTTQSTSDEIFIYSRKRNNDNNNNNNDDKSLNCGNANYVYRTTKPLHDLKPSLLCRNTNKDKWDLNGSVEGGKCLCENCGIVGLLMESQRHPVEYPSRPTSAKSRSNKKPKNPNSQRNHYDAATNNFEQIDELSRRIKDLEERLAIQEERAIHRDYFKHIISKLVANFTAKHDSTTQFHDDDDRNHLKYSQSETIDCFHVTTLGPGERSDKATVTEDDSCHSGAFWKWGEEILKPGIDLKNKIVTLLADIFSRLNLSDKAKQLKRSMTNDKGDCHSEAFKKFADHINQNVFNVQTNHPGSSTRPSTPHSTKKSRIAPRSFVLRTVPELEKNVTNASSPSPERAKKVVDVAYVNPKLSTWPKESQCVCKVDSFDNTSNCNKTCKKIGREEFLRIIWKAKNSQKELLWKNIWNQAKANGQGRDDQISIKIPMAHRDSKLGTQTYEVELTIGELERVLLGHRDVPYRCSL